MARKKITKADYYKATGLLYLAHEYEKKREDIEAALGKLLGVEGDDGYYGHVSDCTVETSITIDNLLEKLHIKKGKK
ncbi:unnamed protein product [marine sediment metagenome]|uniref:Uncharacterized protein n=1 Tax=marine sediment metagenome TaxID=412755 RepID=X0V6P2_9ZZZZ